MKKAQPFFVLVAALVASTAALAQSGRSVATFGAAYLNETKRDLQASPYAGQFTLGQVVPFLAALRNQMPLPACSDVEGEVPLYPGEANNDGGAMARAIDERQGGRPVNPFTCLVTSSP